MVEQLNPTLLWHSQAPRKQFEKVQLAEGFWSSWVAPPQDEQIFQVDPSSIMAEKGIATQSKKQAAAIEALLILKQFETYTHHGWSISLDSPLIVNELHIVTSHGGKLMGRVFPKTRWLFETWPWPLRRRPLRRVREKFSLATAAWRAMRGRENVAPLHLNSPEEQIQAPKCEENPSLTTIFHNLGPDSDQKTYITWIIST